MNSKAYEAGYALGGILVVVFLLALLLGSLVFLVVCIRKAKATGSAGWIIGVVFSSIFLLFGGLGTLGAVASLVTPALLKARGKAVTLVQGPGGAYSIEIPGHWKEVPQLSEDAEISATDPLQTVCAMVLRDPKSDFTGDLVEFDDITVGGMEGALTNPMISGPEERTLGGCPAIYRRLTGTVDRINIVYHRYSVETADDFLQVMVWTTPSREAQKLGEMTKILESFKSAAGPPR